MKDRMDNETIKTLSAHYREYIKRRRKAYTLGLKADWLFLHGAARAAQRLLFVERNRAEELNIPAAHRKYHGKTGISTCFVCMGSGIHPQGDGGTVNTERMDRIISQTQAEAGKLENPPTCPACGGSIEFGNFIGSERVTMSCTKCETMYRRHGWASVNDAVAWMRKAKDGAA